MRELVNVRHPWDARVKVGSERKFASSDTAATGRNRPPWTKSVVLYHYFARGGPPNQWISITNLAQKKTLNNGGIWPSRSWYCYIGIYFPIDRCDPDCYHYFTQILSCYRPKTRLWAPKPPPDQRGRAEVAAGQLIGYTRSPQQSITKGFE